MEVVSSVWPTNTTTEVKKWDIVVPDGVTMMILPFSLAIMALFGVLGNIWVFITICRYKRFHTAPYILLANLAAVDALLSGVVQTGPWLLNMVVTYMYGAPPDFYASNCHIIGYTTELVGVVEPMCMVSVAINRYVMVIYATKYKHLYTVRRTLLYVVIMYVMCVVISLPTTAITDTISMGYASTMFMCAAVHGTDHFHYAVVFFTFITCCILLLGFCYFLISRKVYLSRQATKQHTALRGGTGQALGISKKEMSLVVQFIIICGIFIVSHSLFLVFYTIYVVVGSLHQSVNYTIMFFWGVNAAINPAVYLIFNKDLSKHMLCSCSVVRSCPGTSVSGQSPGTSGRSNGGGMQSEDNQSASAV